MIESKTTEAHTHLQTLSILEVEWGTGEITWEPLSIIIASDPDTCAIYAKQYDLLNTPGWKLLNRHARTARRLIRTLKKSKYRQAKASRKYKHGWEVPRDYAHALQLDIQNGNNKWKDAIDLEIEQIKEYQVFKDYGRAAYENCKITNAPKRYQKIRVHFVFDVKHCGKFKARLVADGCLTKEPNETLYSGGFSLRNLRLAMFLAELNNLQLWGQMLEMHTYKHLQKKNSTLWVVHNLKNYKDMS